MAPVAPQFRGERGAARATAVEAKFGRSLIRAIEFALGRGRKDAFVH